MYKKEYSVFIIASVDRDSQAIASGAKRNSVSPSGERIFLAAATGGAQYPRAGASTLKRNESCCHQQSTRKKEHFLGTPLART